MKRINFVNRTLEQIIKSFYKVRERYPHLKYKAKYSNGWYSGYFFFETE